jgi:hypothetical protein
MRLRLQFAQGLVNGRIPKAYAEFANHPCGFHAPRLREKSHHHWVDGTLCRQGFHFFSRDAWRPCKAERVGNCIKVIRHFHLSPIDHIADAAGPAAKQRDEGDSSKVIGMNVIREDIIFLTKGRLLRAESCGGQALMAIVDARYPQHVRSEWPQGPLCIKPTQ